MLAHRYQSLAVGLAVFALVVLAVFGGVAAAGALPDGMQSAVSHAAAHIGIDLPEGDQASAREADLDDQTTQTEATAAESTETHVKATESTETVVTATRSTDTEVTTTESIEPGDEAETPTSVTTRVPGAYDHTTLPDEAKVPESVPNNAGYPRAYDHTTLPEQAHVPSTVPVKKGQTSTSETSVGGHTPGPPDHVSLPENAKVPPSVPVGKGQQKTTTSSSTTTTTTG